MSSPSERILRISGKKVPEGLAREVFFSDARINVLGLLIHINVVVVLLNSSLQIVIAVLDVRYLIEVLALVPLIFNIFNFFTAVLFGMAKVQKSPRLLVTSLILPLASAGFGVIGIILFVATTILSCSPCLNSSCPGVIACGVIVCIITSIGLVVNYAVYRVLDELLLNNTTLNERVIMMNLQRVSGSIDPSQIGGISEPIPCEGETQLPVRTVATSELCGTIFDFNAIANEGFTFVKLDS